MKKSKAFPRHLLHTTAFFAVLVALPHGAKAGPGNGTILGGSADIDVSGSTTTINQSSDRALIRWDSFDVDAMEHVKFQQPSSSSITVNRIRDVKASRIDGSITANGNIVLINPNGMVFGAGSVVNVGSLVATTSDLEDDNAFMNGGAVKFTKPGQPDAKIVNNGTMTVGTAGLVGLVAPHVENNGVIQARLGKVALASGDIHTIDFAGDGLIKLEVSDAVLSQSVKNTGLIDAEGGDVLITAAQARHMVDVLITNTGTIRANTIQDGSVTHKGSITISTKGLPDAAIVPPKAQGEIINSGTIEAVGEVGGDITILADAITLGDGSEVYAYGESDGGSIRIGGDYQGGNNVPTSDTVFIGEHVILSAGSRRNGNGGKIILWSDENTRFYGHADASGGAYGGNGGLIEISGKKYLDFSGTVDLRAENGERGTLLLDPTNIVISAGADQNVSGTSPYTPTIDDGTSVLNVTTLQNALAAGNVIVQTRATGSQQGNITVSSAITWTSGNTLTLDAHNNIVIGGVINGGSLTLIAGGDVNINSNTGGTGTFTLRQANAASGIGLGDTQVGVISLATAEVGRIVNGWNSIVIGRTDGSGAINMGTLTWNDNLTFQSGTGTINVYGVQTMGTNTLTIITDGDLMLGATNVLYGSTTLTIQGASASTSIGLGDGMAGTINLTTLEVARIRNGWGNLVFGRTDGTGAIEVGALTWNDFLTLQTGSGQININGVQTMAANNLTVITNSDLNIGAALTGSGTLTIQQTSNATSMALGTGQTGTLLLDDTELGRITDGWASLVFGTTTNTAGMNVAARTWTDALTLQSGSGTIAINGIQTMGVQNMVIRTDGDLAVNAGIISTGTGTLAIVQSSASTSMGLGDGQAGTINLTDAEIDLIHNAWAGITIGRTDGSGAVNVGDHTWLDPLTLRSGSGVMTIGNLTMGGNALSIIADGDIALNGDLKGSGNLTLSSTTQAMALGDGQTGAVTLSNAEMARLVNGWALVTLGTITSTTNINLGAKAWDDPLAIRAGTGIISINGAQTMGVNNLTLTSNATLNINGSLSGSGTLTIAGSSNATTIGIGTGQTGALSLSNASIANIADGWANIVFGTTSTSGAMNVGASTWNDALILRTSSGIITVNGAVNVGANALTIQTSANLALNSTLSGTGNLTIYGSNNANTIGIGSGQSGTINLTDSELGLISDGWATLIFGSTSTTGAMNIGAYTWLDNVDFRTNSGAMNINGAQNVGGNNLVLRTNTNLAIGVALTGTGTLSILGSSGGTSMGIGTGQAGTLSLTDAELAFITDGWSSIALGSTGMTGAMNIGAYTWNDSVIFRTAAGQMNVNGNQNVGANNLTLQTNSAIALNGNLTGTGTLTIHQTSTNVTMGLGTGSAGTVLLDDTELGRIQNGWGNLMFGNTGSTVGLVVGTYTWNDNVTFRTGSGAITVSGTQTMGANDLTFLTGGNPVLNGNLVGTGKLYFTPSANTVSMGVGASMSGTVNFSEAELLRIIDGWGEVIFGRNDTTSAGVINIANRTWTDNVTFRSGAGIITIAGATMGASNLTFQTNANLAINANLTGTGILNISTASGLTEIAVGNGQTGALALSNTELARFADGWDRVVIGSESQLGAVNIGAYTWVDPMYFVTQGNINLNGDQTSTVASGTSLVYATTNGAFLNTAGSDAINPGGGRYLIYSVDGARDTLDGLMPSSVLLNKSYQGYGPSSVVETGNISLYSGAGIKTIYLTIDDKDKAYGYNLPTLTYTYIGGLQGSDTLNDVILSYTLSALGSSALDDAGTTRSITGSFNMGLGYTVSVISGTLTVTKATLLVQADNESRQYGLANPAFNLNYIGFRNGDDITDIDTAASVGSAATILSDVGSYAIVGSGAIDDNYDFQYVNGTLSITKAMLTATVQASSREYGDANPTYNIVYTGFRNGDTQGVIDTLATGSSVANALSGVGTYAVTAAGGIDNNYNFTYVGNNMTVTKATVTATTQNATREYGDSNPALSVAYTGFKNGENQSVINTLATASTAANALSDVGAYAITATGASDDNYNIVYANTGNLSVTKATVTVTANNATREYGAADPAYSAVYTGFKNGQNQGVIDTLATFATPAATIASDVGNYNIVASGATDNNYTFNYVNGTLSVTKAMLTATVQANSRVYGDSNPGFTIVYTGFRNSDTQSVIDTLASASTSANALSDVGSYAVSASGAADNNYNFTYVGNNLGVTKATLTATTQNASRDYGDANPTLGVVYTGFKNGQNQGVIDTLANATTGAGAATGVGSYGVSASGASDNNYDFVYANTGVLVINKAMLTATVQASTREYGDVNPTFSIVYTGFKNSDTEGMIDTLATGSTAANALSDVGNYTVSASGASDNNYNFTYVDGTMGITKAILTATTQNAAREYGDANPAMGVVYTGFKNGQNQSVIDTLATATSSANALSDVGSYGISASGAVDDNYNFVYSNTGNLAVTKATVTVTADNISREYGDTEPSFSASYSGFKNGQNQSVIDTLATLTPSATILSDVGSYAIVASGASDNNYNFVYVDGTLGITKATVTVTAGNASREYGDANPGFTAAYTGFKNGQNQSVIDTLATVSSLAGASTNVGNHAINAGGASDNNYNFNYMDGTLTITKAMLTATAQNATRSYGDANPAFGVSYTGFKNGETQSVIDTLATGSSLANNSSGVGSYMIAASGSLDNNYDFTYANGTLTIGKAMLVATADNHDRLQNDPNPPLTISYSGFKNGETASVLTTLPTASTTAAIGSPIGAYAIVVSGGFDDNYTITGVNGVMNVLESLYVPPPPQTTLPVTVTSSISTPAAASTGTDLTTASSETKSVLKNPIRAHRFYGKRSAKKRAVEMIVIPHEQIYMQQNSGKDYLIAISDDL